MEQFLEKMSRLLSNFRFNPQQGIRVLGELLVAIKKRDPQVARDEMCFHISVDSEILDSGIGT